MSSNKSIKFKFFEKGVQAYKNYTGQSLECYCCPICCNIFTRADLENGKLTLEHVPPKSQGGKGIALTCSSCNNTSGYSIDAEVANREEVLKASALLTQKGSYDGDIALTFGDGDSKPLNFRLNVENGHVNFYLQQKHNHPNAQDLVLNFFEGHNKQLQGVTSSIKFSTRRRYKARLANIGYLKSAFLVCFAAFGYTYAFDKNLEIVRRQIINPTDDILKCYIIRSGGDTFEKDSLVLLESPTNALGVLFNDTAILLPLPSFVLNTDLYEFLVLSYPNTSKINFTGTKLEWPASLLLKWDFEIKNTQP